MGRAQQLHMYIHPLPALLATSLQWQKFPRPGPQIQRIIEKELAGADIGHWHSTNSMAAWQQLRVVPTILFINMRILDMYKCVQSCTSEIGEYQNSIATRTLKLDKSRANERKSRAVHHHPQTM